MKKIISVILSVAVCLCFPFISYGAEIDKNNVKCKSAILMDIDSKAVLYSNNEFDQASPASVTKIMPILLAIEALDANQIKLTDKVTASKSAVSMGGSQIWLEEGESMTVDELLKATIIASANDACTALGEYIAGSSTAFVNMMNDRALDLGLQNTHFENCTGLDDTTKNHYSCAYDLAVIASEVMKHSKVLDYTTIWLDSLRDGKTELNNTNKLVNTYNGITGLKTGTTSNAGFCVCATASRDDMNLVAVVLGADTSESRFETASYLLDWGFANFKSLSPKIDKNKITPVKIIGGETKTITPIYNDIKILLNKNNDNLTYKYKIDKTAKAPIKRGQSLGEIEILCDKKRVATINLVSSVSVKKITLSTIFRHLLIKI